MAHMHAHTKEHACWHLAVGSWCPAGPEELSRLCCHMHRQHQLATGYAGATLAYREPADGQISNYVLGAGANKCYRWLLWQRLEPGSLDRLPKNG